jgi:predicted nucleic acid-binding protein
VIYPDTSFLIAFYTPEEDSERARTYASRATAPFIYTPFHRLETRTALRARVFREHMTAGQLRAALHEIDEGLEDELLQHVPLDWNAALREAEEIGTAHGAQTGARSGDILHVASALVLEAAEFCTFDQRQAVLAKRAGLKVKAWR